MNDVKLGKREDPKEQILMLFNQYTEWMDHPFTKLIMSEPLRVERNNKKASRTFEIHDICGVRFSVSIWFDTKEL
ncbi:MAG: hypothetical protein ABIH23_16785 [bacterium]